MTGKDLFDQMLALGGKESFVEEEIFNRFHALNRAAFEVNRLFPVTRKIQLVNYPLTPVAFYGPIRVHRGGEDITIDASGVRSLAFAVSGGDGEAQLSEIGDNGEIIDGIQKITFGKTPTFEIKRVLIPDGAKNVRLVFKGNFNYLIRNISFYGAAESEHIEDVNTYSSWAEYDVSEIGELGERFIAFDSAPVRFNDLSLDSPHDYRVEGSTIYLRADKPGVYEVTVLLKPSHISNDTDNVEVDPQLEDLVALRAAVHLYSLTDNEIADRCNAEYQRLLPLVMAKLRRVKTQNVYRNVLKGW